MTTVSIGDTKKALTGQSLIEFALGRDFSSTVKLYPSVRRASMTEVIFYCKNQEMCTGELHP